VACLDDSLNVMLGLDSRCEVVAGMWWLGLMIVSVVVRLYDVNNSVGWED
jgi:hypothetical protein